MKLCFISSYPPSKEGVGEYTARMVADLSDQNIETSIITFRSTVIRNEKNVFRIIDMRRRSRQSVYKTLASIKPDVIHVQYAVSVFRFLSFVAWPAVRRYQKDSGCKLIVTLHEPKRELAYLRPIIKPFYRWLGRISDQVWVLTSESKRLLIMNCGMQTKKVKIIPHGLYSFRKADNSRVNFLQAYGLKDKDVLLFFGYIHIDKGLQFLIDAFAEIARTPIHKNTRLVIAGTVRPRAGIFKIFELIDHVYKIRIKKRISNYSLQDKVTWTGYIERKDVLSIFKASSIILLPYTKAEQSGVLNIALASKRPIVASNIGGFHEMLKDVGILVPVAEPVRIAKAIDDILVNRDKSIALVKAYKQVQIKFSPNAVSEQLTLSYKELVSA